ncbi:uncharacterized protein LOC100213905 [Hydra vulgaris]|uniref:Uncharacterized protein LOC100213905 n=1 Tax=Hydra vulgaris TaxID=6087 RepID=A0ABM4DDP2_HYDVU
MELDSGASTNGEELPKTFQERLSEIPTYTMTLSQLQSWYTSIKDRNAILKSAINTGENYANRLAAAAKPVVIAATNTALKVAKPVVGEISDPVAALDSCASEVLAKVQEKAPFIKQTPKEIAEHAKEKAQETSSYVLDKLTLSNVGQETTKQLDNVVSFSELMVEIVFPTDGKNAEDLKEIEKAEEDEDKGLVVRAANLKDKTIRRGTRKLMTYQPVKTAVDMVQYTQARIMEMTEKLKQGSNYVTVKSLETKNDIEAKIPEIKKVVEENLTTGSEFLTNNWDYIYQTTMYIPKKAIQVTGEVYISAQEIVFAYSKAHSLTEIPHAVVEMVEKYYKSLKSENLPDLKDKAVAFVYVPAHVVSEYIRSTKVVQWFMPENLETEMVQVVEEDTKM